MRHSKIWVMLIVMGVYGIQTRAAISSGTEGKDCAAIVKQMADALQRTCVNIGRNKVCYGSSKVEAEFQTTATAKFDTVGDIVAVNQIKTLRSYALSPDDGLWGLAVLKLQANLPDTLPGQNVIFLVFGETTVDNLFGDMETFYFSSGLGNTICKAAPTDGILIKAPEHTKVNFTANDVQITLGSTVLLRAEPGKAMIVQLIEGTAVISTASGSQTLQPGQQTSIVLAGRNGLSANSAPSLPEPAATDLPLNALVSVVQSLSSLTSTPVAPDLTQSPPGDLIPTALAPVQTLVPSVIPSIVKTLVPTVLPPVQTLVPSVIPSTVKTLVPSAIPSVVKTLVPTLAPIKTLIPSLVPTLPLCSGCS